MLKLYLPGYAVSSVAGPAQNIANSAQAEAKVGAELGKTSLLNQYSYPFSVIRTNSDIFLWMV